MPHKIRKKLIFNQKWHRRMGLGITVMVFFLAVTGILLNHSPALDLARKHLRADWLLSWYGLESPDITGVQIDGHWLSQAGEHSLFLNTIPVADCPPPLYGAAQTSGLLLALCRETLVLLTPSGELIEKLDTVSGLPMDMTQLQVREEQVYIGNGQNTYSIDLDSLAVTVQTPLNKGWSAPVTVPEQLANQLREGDEQAGISLETLILDLHSGRFFGTVGVWFVDLIGILLCVLAVTGILTWINRRKLNGGGR